MNDRAREAARTIQSDYQRLKADVQGAAAHADRVVHDGVSAAPLVAVGTAAAFGFLIGGGVPRSALAMFLGVGARMAGSWLQREFLERTDPQE